MMKQVGNGGAAGLVRAVLILLLLAGDGFQAFANPFLAAEDASAPAPVLRSPSSSGPLPGAQMDLRERAASAVQDFAAEPSTKALAALLGAAFAYGVLHAAGPGHRKTVVFSLFLGRGAAAWEPLAAGFLAAGAHAGAGLALVALLTLLKGAIAPLAATEATGVWLEAATFGLLALFALALIAHKLGGGFRRRDRGTTRTKEGGLYGIVLVTSLVPCPGATMLLLFSLYAGLPWLGAAGVLAMSLGMGLVISAAGYLAWGGREGLFARLKLREAWVARASDLLELSSYGLILAVSLYALWPLLTH